jgi:glycosyltransferase involved in cell wall biosynthesis
MIEPVFSIIIPHKNSPELLQRCLNSIPRREDIQIIVVDDNSDDSKVDFSRFPRLEDKYVEIYLTKEGKGAGYARNIGLSHAKGKWLLFADADDFFTEKAFEYLFAEEDSHHEIIYFKITSCFSDTFEPATRDKFYNQLVDNYIYNCKNSERKMRYKWGSPCAKLIKKELVDRNNIRFEEIIASNDIMFSLYTGYFAKSITAVDNIVYCATVAEGSLTNTVSLEFCTIRYLVVLRYNEFLRSHKQRQYQQDITPFLYHSLKYGIIPFLKYIKLSIKHNNYSFISFRSIYSFILSSKERKKREKYIKN